MKLDESLASAQASARWLDTPAIARAAARRVRRRAGLVGAGVIVVAAAVLVPLLTTGSSTSRTPAKLAVEPGVKVGAKLGSGVQLVADSHPVATADAAAAAQVATAEQSFSIALLKQLDTTSTDANLSVSPASLALALAMLQNGARGSTLAEMQKTLRTTGLSTQQQDSGWSSLVSSWDTSAAADKIAFTSANSLFVQTGFPITQPFLAALGEYYNAGTWQVDFAGQLAKALKTINAWTAQQTHDKITKLFEPGQLDSSTVAVLANAVYFKAPWQMPFDPGQSKPGDFYSPTGTTHPTFMTSFPEAARAVIAPSYDAAQLPYTNGRFAALAIMPTSGSLSSFVTGLNPGRLTQIATSLAGHLATVTMPRFTTTSSNDLGDVLATLGMPTAFSSSADFTGMSPAAPFVQAVEQRVYLKVNEAGTEAAAVTGVQMIESGIVGKISHVTLDRPFLFLIRDTKTGAILFASEIQNPTE